MTIELHNNVYCEGEGLPVVLVHGFPVDHRMWDECAEALEAAAVEHGVKRFPIWGPDMPGAGEGPIPSDETSGGKDADGAFPNGLDHMADAYVAMLPKIEAEAAPEAPVIRPVFGTSGNLAIKAEAAPDPQTRQDATLDKFVAGVSNIFQFPAARPGE